jgi:hypothetical protein
MDPHLLKGWINIRVELLQIRKTADSIAAPASLHHE